MFLVQFLRMAILTFKMDHLLLITLIDVQERVSAVLPATVLCISSYPKTHVSNVCPDCPTSRMTLVQLSSYHNFRIAHYLLRYNYTDTNRLVLLPQSANTDRQSLAQLFAFYNAIMVVVDWNGQLTVFAWCRWVDVQHLHLVSKFTGTEVFRSHDLNALLFRKQLQHWPKAPVVQAVVFTTMMAPYSFLVRDEATTGQLRLASSSLTLFQIVGDALRFTVNVHFFQRSACSACFEPLPMRNNRGLVTLFDYDPFSNYKQ